MAGRAYTKEGDAGYTRDFSDRRLPKDDPTVVFNGKIDTLQSCLDAAVLEARGRSREMLETVRRKLWQSAGEISCASGKCLDAPVTEADLAGLERFIDALGKPPARFVRFDTRRSITLNECRVRCRELEICAVQLLRRKKLRPLVFAYLNRLSSLFFMLALKASSSEPSVPS